VVEEKRTLVDVAFLSSPVEIRRVQGTSGENIPQINSVTRDMQERKLVQEDNAEASVRNRAPKKGEHGRTEKQWLGYSCCKLVLSVVKRLIDGAGDRVDVGA